MQDCYDVIIYIFTKLILTFKSCYILGRVSFIRFLLAIPLFSVAIRYLVKVPSSALGGLKRSYDRKAAKSQYKKSK